MSNTKPTTKSNRKPPLSLEQWAAIEADYRAGILSNRQIGKKHGCSDKAVGKRAEQFGWKKDLANAIRARAQELVRTQEVRNEVRASITDEEIIEDNANLQAEVIREHRTDIQKHRGLASKLLCELEFVTDNQELFEQLGELLIDPYDSDGKINQAEMKRLQALNRAIDMTGRVDSLKKLSDTLKTIIALEREAFAIDGKQSLGETLESMLEKLNEEKDQ